jgi:CBS domain-containing protein
VSDTTSTLTAADVMRTGLKTVPSTMTLPELEQKLIEEKVSGYPVVDAGKLIGVVSRSDIVAQICAEREVAERTSDFYFDETGFHESPMQSSADIADRIGERLEQLTVADVMSRHPLTVALDASISDVAHRFAELHVHRLPVVDDGTLVGIVTTMDLVRLIADKRLVPKR